MQVTIHKQIEILDDIFPRWEHLKKDYYETTFFQDVKWIKSWWESHSKKKVMTPYIVEIKKGKMTIGILPLYLTIQEFSNYKFRILKPMGKHLSDYLLPICTKEYPLGLQLDKAFEKIYEDESSWDSIDWSDIPEESKFDVYLRNSRRINTKYMERNQSIVCPYLELDENIDVVRDKFSKKFLKGILYYERKLKREGQLNYYKVKKEAEIEPVMNDLFEQHIERWEKTDTPSQFRFVEEQQRMLKVAKDLFDKNLLHLSYLSHNGVIAAVEFGMADDTHRYLYIGSINTRFRKYPIGHILLYHLVIEACQEGYEIMDFLRGEESYKQRVGTINRYNMHYKFYNRSMRSLLVHRINNTYHSELFYEKTKIGQVVSKSITRSMALILHLPLIRE